MDWLILGVVLVAMVVLCRLSWRAVDRAIASMPLGDLTDDDPLGDALRRAADTYTR